MVESKEDVLTDEQVAILIGKIRSNMATRPSIATGSLIEMLEGLHAENKSLKAKVDSLQNQIDAVRRITDRIRIR